MPRDQAKKRASNRAWYERNREQAIASAKRWGEDNPERKSRSSRELHLRKKYGITIQQFEAMLTDQGGVCAICSGPPGKLGLHVDHDHRTGSVRSLLCFRCNGALHYVENVEWLTAATLYLEGHEECRKRLQSG